MFREMRRSAQAMPQEAVEEILQNVSTGVLAVSGDDGYPYAVPINFVYYEGKIYFHCAKEGHKIDGIKRNEKVSLCVVSEDTVHPQEYTTYYRSVIVFGRAKIITDESLIIVAVKALVDKHPNGFTEEEILDKIKSGLHKKCVVEIEIDHMTGKENHHLAEERRKKDSEDEHKTENSDDTEIEDYISDKKEVRMARAAVRIELEKRKAMGLPIIVYDSKTQKIYEESSDGTRVEVGERMWKEHYSERVEKEEERRQMQADSSS